MDLFMTKSAAVHQVGAWPMAAGAAGSMLSLWRLPHPASARRRALPSIPTRRRCDHGPGKYGALLYHREWAVREAPAHQETRTAVRPAEDDIFTLRDELPRPSGRAIQPPDFAGQWQPQRDLRLSYADVGAGLIEGAH